MTAQMSQTRLVQMLLVRIVLLRILLMCMILVRIPIVTPMFKIISMDVQT